MPEEADATKFFRLAKEWQKTKNFRSSIRDSAIHPAYQQMIGMGEKALPFIFEQLEREEDEPNHWFWALAAITSVNPVPKESQGRIGDMAKAWLEWGKRNGFAVD